jgi:rhodanese-related sulfurtransferase
MNKWDRQSGESARAGGKTRKAERERKTPEELVAIVAAYAASDGWLEKVRLSAKGRWRRRVEHGADYDLWLHSWLPGQATGVDKYVGSSSAMAVAMGVLEARSGEMPLRMIAAGETCAFRPGDAYELRNTSQAPAVSIHAYSPPLRDRKTLKPESDDESQRTPASTAGPSGIEQMLAAARARLRRLSPAEAYEKFVARGATLVDIRPEQQRAQEGEIKGALVVERNVLEWRFDPTCSARLPIAKNHGIEIIVFCSEGYTSSLAAAALQDLGLHRATDVEGGFQAWRRAGLPVLPGKDHSDPEG